MFDKDGEMKTAKSAGSPAFMPPELCVAKHGHVSGKAADIWSMGCTLFCLLFGRIPFEEHGMLELYQAIRNDEPEIPDTCNPELKELLQRLLDKDPKERITMDEIRVRRIGDPSMLNANSGRNIPGLRDMGQIHYSPNQRTSRSSLSHLRTKKSTPPSQETWVTL
tara:strand:- start:17350 stop:17844 length:495 start_codon:yes stop_codon:yes gene_type:complete